MQLRSAEPDISALPDPVAAFTVTSNSNNEQVEFTGLVCPRQVRPEP
jgi:hypothetical protein